MIVAERKPIDEIKEMVKSFKRVLNVGCGGCTSICHSGGQKEVDLLNEELNKAFELDHIPLQIDSFTIERQCNADFYLLLDEKMQSYDAVLSMACGAGVQFLSDRIPEKPVFPALNTIFVGVDRDLGWFEENCRSCGECVLGKTGGICPVTRCAKSLFNGPCGGTAHEGKCEVSKDTPCAWYEIHKRLKQQNRLENILLITPAREWRNQTRGTLVQEAYKERYAK
ncbi:MAG: methylenetetrahydrofolate reductase C-terminal domain-containing protein [Deltaproteobacteria bacterium]|nr:methylenetetrahydrofolate reductase C-terminal domain-containing protein [Deltaproteobacteria bacterium]